MRLRLPIVVLCAALGCVGGPLSGGVFSVSELLPPAADARPAAESFEYCFWNEGASYLARPVSRVPGGGLGGAQTLLVRALQTPVSTETFTGLQPAAGLPSAASAGEGNFSVAMVPEPATWLAGAGLLVAVALAYRGTRRERSSGAA
ncbi:MAG: hypothetical protein JSR82_08670 [Verrucomicrobia bacterium]|nr:hypothetical protein [Verrucomicrobiota bacterium]